MPDSNIKISKRKVEEIGYWFTWGALRAVILMIIILSVVTGVLRLIGYGMDDTDSSRFNRSGMSIHIDAKTGLQYLSVGKGGLIPRLDNKGRHMKEESYGDELN